MLKMSAAGGTLTTTSISKKTRPAAEAFMGNEWKREEEEEGGLGGRRKKSKVEGNWVGDELEKPPKLIKNGSTIHIYNIYNYKSNACSFSL